MVEIKINSLEELPQAVDKFIEAMDDRTVFAFKGEMGAGKTTFISELCRRLGVEDIANSPSFSIINEYRSESTAELIYHFDFYRLESPEEAFEIGAEDYFESGALCFVEWPERVEDLLPGDTRVVELTVLESGERLLRMDD
jgi:tRNA threonylcarbamoyladenosine biosynthesis protein TsaE